MTLPAVDRAGWNGPAQDAETLPLPSYGLICCGKFKSIEDVAYKKAPKQTDEESCRELKMVSCQREMAVT